MRRALVGFLLVCGCEGRLTTPEALPSPEGAEAGASSIPPLPAASTCQAVNVGRSYRGLAGEVLETGRLDTDPSFDRLRPLPNPNQSNEWSLLSRIQGSVGGDHFSHPSLRDPSVGNTFGNIPPRWYDEADVGAFSLSLVFNFAFDSCLYAFQNQRNYRNTTDWFALTDAVPTPDTARRFCNHSVKHALSREPRTAEVDGCVSTILEVMALGEETDPRRLWAYGCAYAVATPMYLTY